VQRTTDQPAPLGQRLAWFVGLWAAGVLSVGAVATALHYVMRGLH
jgi:hypothetical protein